MTSYKVIKIIYEDNHLLVAEKPVNMLSQEDISGDEDILTLLKEYIKQEYGKPGNVYLGLLHRLDRPVGGVMVFAKNSIAAARISRQIRDREFGKIYMAVIHGNPTLKEQQGLEHYLLKDRARNIVSVVDKNVQGAQKALLDYRVIQEQRDLTLVRIILHTGRSHQIRVQMAALGHPLYGDQKYGGHLNQPGQQIALWSSEIELAHPTLKTRMTFSSRPPKTHPWNLFNPYL